MVDTPQRSDGQPPTAAGAEAEDEAVARVEAYDDEDGVVLYDAENPLAWIQATRTVRVQDCC
ncbi:MAG: hypothetical protein V5A62_02725 [Haloarculaceae archaeon]